MSSNAPIGVFDSGIGGLTVVKEIMQQLPAEDIIYFGDTARVPYGNKSKETVITYSRQIVKFLQNKQVKSILIACNTASAFALETLRHEFSLPLVGVVKPGAKAAADATKEKRIGIIGTEGTIKSGVYEDFLKKTNPDIRVFATACPLFVPLVEEGWISDPITKLIAERYLEKLKEKQIDALVLGCTHYPLLQKELQEVMGPLVTLVNPAYESAKSLKYVLEEYNLLKEPEQTVSPTHHFYVSDNADTFRHFANSILPCEMIETKDVEVQTFD